MIDNEIVDPLVLRSLDTAEAQSYLRRYIPFRASAVYWTSIALLFPSFGVFAAALFTSNMPIGRRGITILFAAISVALNLKIAKYTGPGSQTSLFPYVDDLLSLDDSKLVEEHNSLAIDLPPFSLKRGNYHGEKTTLVHAEVKRRGLGRLIKKKYRQICTRRAKIIHGRSPDFDIYKPYTVITTMPLFMALYTYMGMGYNDMLGYGIYSSLVPMGFMLLIEMTIVFKTEPKALWSHPDNHPELLTHYAQRDMTLRLRDTHYEERRPDHPTNLCDKKIRSAPRSVV